ncbi:hypothetical protein [Citreimonas salinaria]|uniref:hypothetical protein n=1 Tax=Citreimonas salinaria TaxID=321339 RepID=UPI0015A6B7B7|nr:hypothetical protein [Citreimonas salinaria]
MAEEHDNESALKESRTGLHYLGHLVAILRLELSTDHNRSTTSLTPPKLLAWPAR